MGLDAERGDGKQQVEVVMQPGETAIFCVGEEAAAEYQAATQELLRISDNWGIEFERWEREDASTDSTATRKSRMKIDPVPLKPWTELFGAEAS